MMLEPVCIVLNEREEVKANAATNLEKRLKETGISSYRLPISPCIAELIIAKRPKILVLDYLLGDISTGLDVVELLKEEQNPPSIYMFTDEPSINVVLPAFRAGVANYFLLSEPNSLNDLVNTIAENLTAQEQTTTLTASKKYHFKIDDLVCASSQNSTLKEKLTSYISNGTKFIGICGNSGVGKSTTAIALHNSRELKVPVHIINLKSSPESIFETVVSNFRLVKNSSGISFIIEHVDYDDGELIKTLDHLKTTYNILEPTADIPLNLTFISNNEAALNKIKSIFPIEILKIPSLSERRPEIESFLNAFIVEAEQLTQNKLAELDAGSRKFICKSEWPGELTQLRSTILTSLSGLSKKSKITQEKIKEHQDMFILPSESDSNLNIHPMVAATILEKSDYNFRIAAIKLGCRPNELIKLINGHSE